jgi:MazG family protein
MTRSSKPGGNMPGEKFERLVEIMRTLRSKDGCPWDLEQTLETLRPFIIEEAYEVIDAIDQGDKTQLMEEIGDLVFECVFLAQLCTENNDFSIEDSLQTVNDKLVRRHPHIFGPNKTGNKQHGLNHKSSGEVIEQWNLIKAQERKDAGQDPGVLSGIPKSLPGLLRSFKIGQRAASTGFDWPKTTDVIEKINEEVSEIRHALVRNETKNVEEEIGDLILAIANLSRKLGVEPETALQRANNKFEHRFDLLTKRIQESGRSLSETTQEELDKEWDKIKEC